MGILFNSNVKLTSDYDMKLFYLHRFNVNQICLKRLHHSYNVFFGIFHYCITELFFLNDFLYFILLIGIISVKGIFLRVQFNQYLSLINLLLLVK